MNDIVTEKCSVECTDERKVNYDEAVFIAIELNAKKNKH